MLVQESASLQVEVHEDVQPRVQGNRNHMEQDMPEADAA